jgi:type VI secretion system protein ImpH
MAATSRGPGTSLIDSLRAEPERFELVQAVRLLERAAVSAARDPRFARPGHLGFDHDPRTEVVSLRAALELAFPVAEIAALDESGPKPQLAVTLLGLNGVSGVLPGFYSQLVLEANRDKNAAPRDFFDMFNHRALSLFVRAAHKYRLPLAYESGEAVGANTFAAALLSLVGLGLPSLQQRQPVSDDTLVFYSGHFGRNLPTASALQQVLAEYFERPVTIQQFQGRWISWPQSEQTQLGSTPPVQIVHATSAYATLGTDAVLGSRVWDVQGSFRVRIGPLDYEQFRTFLPDGEHMRELAALARSYVGPVLSFDVQLILMGADVPPMQLTAEPGPDAARLGWNTWLPTSRPRDDASDAIFEVESI